MIGGLAASAWGQPRATHDADVTIMVPFEKEKEFLEELLGRFPGRITDALDFARKSRVALVRSSSGTPIDVALGIPGYQEEMIRRAVELELDPGVVARVCTAEDLIIHKAVAARGQDSRDILAVLTRRVETLDLAYIRKWLREFDAALDSSKASDFFEKLFQQHTHSPDEPAH